MASNRVVSVTGASGYIASELVRRECLLILIGASWFYAHLLPWYTHTVFQSYLLEDTMFRPVYAM